MFFFICIVFGNEKIIQIIDCVVWKRQGAIDKFSLEKW